VLAAIDVQQHARYGPTLAALPMHPALASTGAQTGALHEPLDPAVAKSNARHSAYHENFAGLNRNTSRDTVQDAPPCPSVPSSAKAYPAAGEMPAEAELCVALPPPSHLPIADADDLRRWPPGNLLGRRPQNHFLYFHCPLRRGPRVGIHAPHGLFTLASRKVDRSRAISTGHIMC